MSDIKSRLTQITNTISGSTSLNRQDPNQPPWDPNNARFPTLDNLPTIEGAPKDAAWYVWGKEDQIGRINLLTPSRVKAAAAEIRTGELVRLDLPLDEPNPPAFKRERFEHTVKPLSATSFDDVCSMNTQSSTQWDGLRHVGHPSGVFYNNIKPDAIRSSSATSGSTSHPLGLSHISEHGIAGRAIFLDYETWLRKNSTPFDPFTRHAISLPSLLACAESQGLNLTLASQGGDVQPGDILLIRVGWTKKYRSMTTSEWTAFSERHGVKLLAAGLDGSSPELRAWIHDCYFAAVASDVPALEAWPPAGKVCLHTTMLPLWGCLIGEFFDLERLSKKCAEYGRWIVFFSSAPPNIKGGVGGSPNATVIL